MKKTDHPAYLLATIPAPPDALSAAARQEWKAVLPLVFELRTARPADLPLLEMLCELKADVRCLEETVRTEGYTTEAGSGGRKAHPGLQNLAAARRQVQNILTKFGLAPGCDTRTALGWQSDAWHKSMFG
jgi:P27 family predicted phage terminase small subunit